VVEGNDRFVEDAGVPLSSFVAPGTGHTIHPPHPPPALRVDGSSFLDWLRTLVDGESPGDVTCTDCGRPGH
jgi:hypothetical protein